LFQEIIQSLLLQLLLRRFLDLAVRVAFALWTTAILLGRCGGFLPRLSLLFKLFFCDFLLFDSLLGGKSLLAFRDPRFDVCFGGYTERLAFV
jgi:hypothetical protein